MSEENKITHEPWWEVLAGDQGSELTQCCETIDEVLDFCARMLYGQSVVKVKFMQIFWEYAEGKTQGWDSPERGEETFKWVMRPTRRGEPRPARYFHHTHDLFGMLIAELRQGTDRIEISQW